MSRFHPSDNHRRCGSMLILVVVTLVIMVMLGTAYMQVARVDRITHRATEVSNIDQVKQAVIGQLAGLLRDDLVDENGNFLLLGNMVDLNGDPFLGRDEPYDYPWTESLDNASFQVRLDNPAFGPAGIRAAAGGIGDDSWLASTAPHFSNLPQDTYWPHLTNLNGVFLRIPTGNNNTTRPVEFQVDNEVQSGRNNELYHDTNVLLTGLNGQALDDQNEAASPMWRDSGFDADGDGVHDSRWTWAPVREIFGVTYVMAVRVVDLSSLINLNVATAYTSNGDAVSGSSTTNWPTSLDLSRLLSRTADPDWEDELYLNDDSLFAYRGVERAAIPTDPGLIAWSPLDYVDGGRFGAWLDGASMYGHSEVLLDSWTYQRYGTGDEIELRYRQGLNNSNVDTDLETAMPTLLRRLASNETSFEDIDYSSVGALNRDEKRLVFFQGGDGGTPKADDPIQDRQFPAIRHMLTTTSGAAVFAPNHHNIHGGDHGLKYDLVWRHRQIDGQRDGDYIEDIDNNGIADRVEQIAYRLEKIFRVTDQESTNNAYLGRRFDQDNFRALDGPEIKQMATEFALAIQDYSDADRVPSEAWLDRDESGGTGPSDSDEDRRYYGLEPVPFIREVYAQIAFEDMDLEDAAGLRSGEAGFIATDLFYDTWVYRAGSQAMVIETGNPFDVDIEVNVDPTNFGDVETEIDTVDKVDLRILIVDGQGTRRISLDEDNFDRFSPSTGSASPLSDFTIEPGARLVIFSNPERGVEEDDTNGGTKGQDLADLGFADNDDGKDIFLKAKSDGRLTFQPSANGANLKIELQILAGPGPDNNFDNADDVWVSYDRFTLDGLDFANGPNPAAPLEFPHPANPTDPLSPHPAHAQGSVARDGAGIRYISNLGKGMVKKPLRTPDHLGYRHSFDGQDDPYDRLLRSDKRVFGDYTLDRLFPDGIVWPSEPLINVDELGDILMFGVTDASDGDLPTRLMQLPTNRRNLQLRDAPETTGIATGLPHRTMVLDEFTLSSPRHDGLDNNKNNNTVPFDSSANDDDAEQLVAGTININTAPLHLATLAAPIPQSISNIQNVVEDLFEYRDDPEARNSLSIDHLRTAKGIASIGEMELAAGDGAAFLTNVFSTRSDFFAAYVKIRGYRSSDFRAGSIESAHFFVIFDRSGIVDGLADSVRILAVRDLD